MFGGYSFVQDSSSSEVPTKEKQTKKKEERKGKGLAAFWIFWGRLIWDFWLIFEMESAGCQRWRNNDGLIFVSRLFGPCQKKWRRGKRTGSLWVGFCLRLEDRVFSGLFVGGF